MLFICHFMILKDIRWSISLKVIEFKIVLTPKYRNL